MGAGTGYTSVGSDARLYLQFSGSIEVNQGLLLAGSMILNSDVIWNGPITLLGTASRFVGGTGPGGPLVLTHSGVISGEGKLNKQGLCRLVLAGTAANTYTGGTSMMGGELFLSKSSGHAIPGNLQITEGRVSLANSNQLSDTSQVDLSGGMLELGARTDTIAALSGTGGEVNFALGTLTTGSAGNTTFSGLLSGFGTTSIIKQGVGTFTLNNSANGGDTLTGSMLVSQGTLQMDGLHPGMIEVGPAGLLTGSGTIGPAVVKGKVCLCHLKAGALNFTGGSAQAVAALGFADSGRITTTGPVDLAGSALTASLSYVPYAGSTFLILENAGTDSITGIFSGLPEGAAVNIGAYVFNISYHGGTGNDIVLTLVSGGLPPLSIDKFTSSPVPGDPGNNAVLIEATGQPGVRHVIESSNDLQWWEVIDEIPVTSDAQGHSSTSFFDDNPDRRFYRVKEVAL